MRSLFIILLGLNCYVFNSLHVTPFDPYPAPSPTIHYKSCKRLDIYSHMKTIASYKLITFQLNRALILFFMWSLFLLWDEISLKIKYVRFQSSLSMLPNYQLSIILIGICIFIPLSRYLIPIF